LPSLISISAKRILTPAPLSDLAVVSTTPAQPAQRARKRKSRSKAALAEQAAKKARKLTAREVEQVSPDATLTAASQKLSMGNPARQIQNGQSDAIRELPGHPSTLVQSSAIARPQPVEPANSSQSQVVVDLVSNQSCTADPIQLAQNNMNTRGPIPIDPAILRQPAPARSSPILVMNQKNSNMPHNQNPSLPSTPRVQNRTSVLWPEAHRGAIANTAAEVLNAIPENAGKRILTFQILDMLGYNPSYIELCELIEGMGFILDRARFAKTLLAAIPDVNAATAQVAESKVSQILRNSLAFNDYHPSNGGFSNVAEGHSSVRANDAAPLETSRPSAESATLMSAPIGNSHNAPHITTPESRGPGSRGPYLKMREHLSKSQSSPSQSEPRRGPGRPRKDGLPPTRRVSKIANGNNLIDPALTTGRSPISQATTQPAGQAPLNVSLKPRMVNMHDGTASAHKSSVIGKKDLVVTSGNEITAQPSGTSANTSSEPREQTNEPSEQPTLYRGNQVPSGNAPEGWRYYAVLAPSRGAKKEDSNSRSSVPTSAPPPPKPVTKEMAARKRTFAEIIDLTADSVLASVEDHPLIVSKVRRVGDTNFQSAEGYGGAQEPATPNALSPHLAATTTPTPQTPPLNHPTPSTNAAVTPQVNPFKDFEDIVKPIDRSVALRKSRYDPKTIARDILIATARHPIPARLECSFGAVKRQIYWS
jgi:hypothetical protein